MKIDLRKCIRSINIIYVHWKKKLTECGTAFLNAAANQKCYVIFYHLICCINLFFNAYYDITLPLQLEEAWRHHFYATRPTELELIYWVDISPKRLVRSISFIVIHERSRARTRSSLSQYCIQVTPVFLKIYFPEDVASEIFQRLISPGIALLIQDWECSIRYWSCSSVTCVPTCAKCRMWQDVEHFESRAFELFLNPLSDCISYFQIVFEIKKC